MKILLIGIHPAVVESLTDRLRSQGEEPELILAAGETAGLRAFHERHPQLVLLQMETPDRQAFRLLQEIRRSSQVPVIVLSDREAEADQVRALDLGADDFVARPFSHPALVARIRALLRRARMRELARAAPDRTLNGRHSTSGR